MRAGFGGLPDAVQAVVIPVNLSARDPRAAV